MKDEELVRECVRKNAIAQKKLFEMYSRKMMGICMRYAEDSLEAQDIMQDGFVKVFNSIGTFQHEGSLEGWIKRIMINTSLDNYRRNKKRKFALEIDGEVPMEIKQEAQIVEGMHSEYLLKVIQKLPEGYRQVFNMFAIEGYSHKEIAEKLGISVNTSKSQYSRARTYIQKILEKAEYHSESEK